MQDSVVTAADAASNYGSIFSSEELGESTAALFRPLSLAPQDRLYVSMAADGMTFDCGARSADPELRVSNDALSGWQSRIPEHKTIGYGRASCAATDFTVLVLNALFRDRIVFEDDNAKTLWTYLLMRLHDQAYGAYLRSSFKLRKALPVIPDGFLDHPDYPLSPYQLVSTVSALNQEAHALFLDPGLGKTVITIARIMNEARAWYQQHNKPYLCLIVCPRNCRSNWKAEIKKFATTPGQVTVLRGGKLDRMKLLVSAIEPRNTDCEWSIVITSYDTVRRTWSGFKMIPWALAVLDESQYIKGWYTDRSEVFLKLRERCDRRMILTGTPIGNTILDLWSQLEFLGNGLSGFTGWQTFKSFYCNIERTNSKGGGREKITGYKNMPMLHERMLRLASIFTKEEVMPQMPEKLYNMREIVVSPQQVELYNQLTTQLAIELEDKSLTINNALTKLLRLAQITSGHVAWDNQEDVLAKRVIEYLDPNPKLEELKTLYEEMLEQDPDHKMIVWCCFIADIELIKKTFGDVAVVLHGGTSDGDRDTAIQQFNCNPEVKMFIGNPSAGGVGVNLRGYDLNVPGTSYASRVVYYSQNWSSITRRQSEDRNHGRERCRGPVSYTDLVVPESIDEEIRLRVMEKTSNALEVVDVQDIMKRVLKWRAQKDSE